MNLPLVPIANYKYHPIFPRVVFLDLSCGILTQVVVDPKWGVIYKIGAISSGEILHVKLFKMIEKETSRRGTHDKYKNLVR